MLLSVLRKVIKMHYYIIFIALLCVLMSCLSDDNKLIGSATCVTLAPYSAPVPKGYEKIAICEVGKRDSSQFIFRVLGYKNISNSSEVILNTPPNYSQHPYKLPHLLSSGYYHHFLNANPHFTFSFSDSFISDVDILQSISNYSEDGEKIQLTDPPPHISCPIDLKI